MSKWFRVDTSFATHPRVVRLRKRLGCSLLEARGVLVGLWALAAEHAPLTGDLSDYDAAEIADWVGWEGEPAHLIAALQDSGWLDDMTVHDWDEWNGEHLARTDRRRAANAQRMRDARAAHVQNTASAHLPGGEDTCATREQHVPRTDSARAERVVNTCATREQHVHRPRTNVRTYEHNEHPPNPPAGGLGGEAVSQLEEAVLAACGEPQTASEVQRWAEAVDELVAARASPQEVHDRAAEYRRRWPDRPCTPRALAANWSQLVPPPPPPRRVLEVL